MTDKFIFFNSSLPRSMSTLLSNIIASNPTIYATPTDPLLEYLYAARANYTSTPEVKAQDPALMLKAWRGFCWGGLQGYAAALSDRPNVCLKSRGISIHYAWFKSFYEAAGKPAPKVICMVRDMRAIFSSMEKLFQQNQERHQEIQNHSNMTGTTLAKRMDVWSTSPPMGLAIERLAEVIRTGTDKQLLFVRAEDLTKDPFKEMKRVYAYLELPEYQHDFNNIEQFTKEDDEVYGLTPTLHKIRPKVEPLKPDHLDILGREICNWVNTKYEWYQTRFGYQ